jgi:AbrB family looped-hinge helix DNA binding protein
MVSITKLSSKGQIVIPSEIREKLNLEEGNLLIVSDRDNSICLKKLELPNDHPNLLLGYPIQTSLSPSSSSS